MSTIWHIRINNDVNLNELLKNNILKVSSKYNGHFLKHAKPRDRLLIMNDTINVEATYCIRQTWSNDDFVDICYSGLIIQKSKL
jgi:hypothetical protein